MRRHGSQQTDLGLGQQIAQRLPFGRRGRVVDPAQGQVRAERSLFLGVAELVHVQVDGALQPGQRLGGFRHAHPQHARLAGIGEAAKAGHLELERRKAGRRGGHPLDDRLHLVLRRVAEELEGQMNAIRLGPADGFGWQLAFQGVLKLRKGQVHLWRELDGDEEA